MFGIKTKILNKIDELLEVNDLEHLRLFPMGYICNHACPMCWREHLAPEIRQKLTLAASTTDLQLNDYMKILTTMPATIKKVSLCGGGEPTLFRGIGTLMSTIKKEKRYGHIITNGSTLKPDFIDLLIRIKWDSMHISVNAATREVYTPINGVDHYDLVIQNIKTMEKRKGERPVPKLRLSFVIQKGNYHEIVPFAKLAISLGVSDIYFGTLIPHDLTLHTPSPFALDSKERNITVGYLEEVVQLIKKYPIKTNIEYVLPVYRGHPLYNADKPDPLYWRTRYCDRVQHNMDIMSNGEVLPCGFGFQLKEDFDLEMNIKSGTAESFWSSTKYRQFRKRLRRGDFYPACRKYCNFFLANKRIAHRTMLDQN